MPVMALYFAANPWFFHHIDPERVLKYCLCD